MLRFGYVSNGFTDHSLEAMVEVLGHLGYQGLGLTLDHVHLDPFTVGRQRLRDVRRLLENAGLTPVIETGTRYFLDPLRKHRPTLISVDSEARQRRLQYYRRAVEVAAELGAEVVSIWSGSAQRQLSADQCWQRLERELPLLLDYAAVNGVTIGFEPEPGMFVEDLAGYAELRRRIPHPVLKLTLDVGHLAVTESEPYADCIRQFADDIVNVHIDDCKDGRHEHLPLGEGEIDFPPVLEAFKEIEYGRLLLVELSRHSAEAPFQAQRSLIYLRAVES